MKRLAAVLLLAFASLVLTVAAEAAPAPLTLRQAIGILRLNGGYVVPPEWDGIWIDSDSTYDCNGVLQETSTGTDTLCAGAAIDVPDEVPSNFDCSGSVGPTSISITCTGSEFVDPCTINYSFTLNATRSGDTADAVSTVSVGSNDPSPCDLFPGICTQVNTHSTRTGPAPPAYCNTPARHSTWGELKIRYR